MNRAYGYAGYTIRWEKDADTGTYTVYWYPPDAVKDLYKKSGFFTQEDACGYAEDCIDEHWLNEVNEEEQRKWA